MQSLTITAADLAPIPFIERCDYNEFLAQLAKRHGAGYLCRPDGTLLSGVVAIPEVKSKHQPKRQAPTLPRGYTGRPMDDMHPQLRGLVVVEERTHADGSVSMTTVQSVKGRVLAAIAETPLTMREIARVTALTTEQVKRVLARYNGELVEPATNKAMNNKWRMLPKEQQEMGPRTGRPSVRERIEQYIAEHGPATSRALSDALGVKPNIVQITAHKSETITRIGKLDGKVNLWGLSNAQTQMANTAP